MGGAGKGAKGGNKGKAAELSVHICLLMIFYRPNASPAPAQVMRRPGANQMTSIRGGALVSPICGGSATPARRVQAQRQM
jgi:hypothetical protein